MKKLSVKDEVKKTIKKEMYDTIVISDEKTQVAKVEKLCKANPALHKCSTCGGKGFRVNKEGIKSICSQCGGNGFLYEKPVRELVGRSTAEKPVKKSMDDLTKEVISKRKVTKEVAQEDLKRAVKKLTFKSFNHKGTDYFATNTMLVAQNRATKDMSASGECKDVLEVVLRAYYKRLGLKEFNQVLGNLHAVKGVRYKVENNVKLYNLAGKNLETTEYVKSGLKLSTKVWIDTKYLQIFNNHRFIYLNPDNVTGVLPVLCINSNTKKLEGAITPIIMGE